MEGEHKNMQILISIWLAALRVSAAPAGVFAAAAPESGSGTSVRLTPLPDETVDEIFDTSELTAGKYTANIDFNDESGVIENVVLQYEGETLFEGGARLISSIGNDVYIYADGKLDFYDEDGGASTLLTFADSYTCAMLVEIDGKRYAVFIDADDRSLYIHNLTDGTAATGDVSDYYLSTQIIYKNNLFNDLQKTGDYFVFHTVYDIDTGEVTDSSLAFRQEGEKLEIFTPDVSNPANANPDGGKLAILKYNDKWIYMNGGGQVAALYDDATVFASNGVAFTRNGEHGYFVDTKLNRISEPLDYYGSAHVYDDIFELVADPEFTQQEYYRVTLESAENTVSVKLTPFPAGKVDEIRDISELTAGKYTAKIDLNDENGVIENIVLQYEGETLFEGGAELISLLGNDVYIYADGKLDFYDEDGGASTLLTFADSYKCLIVNETDGKRCAVFLDSADRSLYIHNLTDDTVAAGDVSAFYLGFGPVHKDDLFNDVEKLGDYFVFLSVYDIDTEEMLDSSMILKQEDGKLEMFTPDVSNLTNANPDGGKLLLFEHQGQWGYINGGGQVVALYDDATHFSPNGAAFVRSGEHGYFVDTKLNRVSELLDFYASSHVYDDVFELFTDPELTQSEYYTVTFETAENTEAEPAAEAEQEPAAGSAGKYIIALIAALILAGAVAVLVKKTKSWKKEG
jgi:hypothetical protein